MKTFLIKNGDIAISPSNGLLTGASKVKQDLACALLEELGGDRFHPRWGSTLPLMVGGVITPQNQMVLVSEARRIISNYIAIQDQYLQRDRVEGRKSRYSADEIVIKIVDVKLKIYLDRCQIRASLQTLAGETVAVSTIVGSA